MEKRGPASAAGLLLYFYGYAGHWDLTQFPMSELYAGRFRGNDGRACAFELDAARRRIVCRIGRSFDLLFVTPRSATELDVELIKSDATGNPRPIPRGFAEAE